MDGYGVGASVLFAATVIVSLLGLYVRPQIVRQAILRPYWLVRKAQYPTLLTCGFVHASFTHLLFNMFTFYFFAFPLEQRIGTVRFLFLYLIGLLSSSLGTYYTHRNDPEYGSLGASGAILAVLFASIVYFPHSSLMILPIPVPIPAPLFAAGYLAYSYYQARHSTGKINHDAHFAGALTGLAFVALTDPPAFGRLAAVVGL